MRFVELFIYYFAFLAWITLAVWVWLAVLWIKQKQWLRIGLLAVLFVLNSLFLYSSFWERWQVVVVEESLMSKKIQEPIKMVLISDLHLGTYKGVGFAEKVVDKLQEIKPDLVVMTGDLINNPSKEELPNLYLPFANLPFPIYTVLGNHDGGFPGDFSLEEVNSAVAPHGLKMIDNQIVDAEFNGQKIRIIGLEDFDAGNPAYHLLRNPDTSMFNLIVAHNPDTAYHLGFYAADLLVAGHTHGGQVRVPGYENAIPSLYGFNKGWYSVKEMQVFVTSGLGEVLLPMRLGVPPEIVVFNLNPS